LFQKNPKTHVYQKCLTSQHFLLSQHYLNFLRYLHYHCYHLLLKFQRTQRYQHCHWYPMNQKFLNYRWCL
jgi:hypothetical protein